MCTREFGAKPFTSLQLVRLDHHPAVSAASPGKPGQWTFIFVDDDFCTACVRRDLALSQNEMLCPKNVDLRLLRSRRRLLNFLFHGHVRTSNPNDLPIGLYTYSITG